MNEYKSVRQNAEKIAMKHEELDLEKRCRAYARRFGWIAAKLEKNGCKGIPDDLFIGPKEQVFLVEFKKDKQQKPRPEQVVWLRRFQKIARLIGSFDDFCDALGLPKNDTKS